MSRRRSMGSIDGTEHDWQQRIIGLAEAYKWGVTHTPDPRRINRSMVGYPDLTLYRPAPHEKLPNVYYRELKMAGGRLTKAQHDWGQHLLMLGFDWDVLWLPNDWHIVEALIIPK